jgi:hypothetical protein
MKIYVAIKDDTNKMQQKSHRPYHKPHLQTYGTVKELTAGGSGTKSEAHAHPLGKDKPAKKSRS